jgi:hypothetical protein
LDPAALGLNKNQNAHPEVTTAAADDLTRLRAEFGIAADRARIPICL